MSETDSGSSSDIEWNGSIPSGENRAQLQYVSAKKLRAQTISGGFDVTTSQFTNPFGAVHFAYHIRVCTPAEGTRGVLENNVAENANDHPSGSYSTMSDSGTVSSVAVQDGDFIVVELGWSCFNSTVKDFGQRIGSGDLFFNNTILWLEPPANLVYPIAAETQLIDDPINTNTPTWTDNGGTFTFTVATGAMPAGMTLNSTTGVISGNPSVDGTFTFTIQVANSEGSTTSNSMTYTIDPPLNCTQRLNDMMSGKLEIG